MSNGASAWPYRGMSPMGGITANAYNASIGLPTGLRSNSSSSSNSGLDLDAKRISDNQYQNAFSQANALSGALGQSYANARNTADSGFSGILSQLAGMGEYDRTRINRSANAQAGSVGQGLMNSGLYNTTMRQNLAQGVERNRNEALGQLDESLRRQSMDVFMQRLSALLGLDQQAIASQQQVGLQGLGFLGEMARTLPNYSRSTSTSASR